MKKRLLSALLVVVMLIGMIPSAAAAEEKPLQAIKIDFMAFAKEAAEQPWWDDIRDTDVDGIKVVGTHGISDSFTAEEASAYSQMLNWLDQNANWTIDEDFTDLNKSYYGKSFFINEKQKDDYGVRLFTNSLNDPDFASKIAFTVYAPQAGTYALNMSVLNEAAESEVHEVRNPAAASGTAGGGMVDLYINDTLAADNHVFANDVDRVEEVSFGAVELKEGANRLLFHFVGDRNGRVSTYRRAVNLRWMEFAPVSGIEVDQYEAKLFDPVALGHLPYGTVLTEDLKITSSDESIFTASVSNGKLLIEGITPGEGTVTVGDLCEIEVNVKAFDGTWGDLKQESIFIDFKSFAKRASMEPWWDELAQVSTLSGYDVRRVGEYYYRTMTDSQHAAYKQMKAWLSDHADWGFYSPHWDKNHMAGDRMYICADDNVDWGVCLNSFYIGMGEDSTFSIAVQAPKAGWYNLKMDIARQNNGDSDGIGDTGFGAGGAYIDVYAGDTLIADHYATKGDGNVKDSFGAVYLNEGENIISMEIVGNTNGNDSVNPPQTYVSRANVNLRSLELTPLTYWQVEEGEEKTVDLRTSFLASFDSIMGFSAQSKDETVAEARMKDGKLILTGKEQGLSKIVLSDEQGTVTEFFVCVTESLGAKTSGDTITVAEDGWYETALTYEKTTAANKVQIFLGDYDLGTLQTMSDQKLIDTELLRPVYLQAGTYEVRVESEKAFAWQQLRLMPCDEPALNLCINPVEEKQYRKVEVPILGFYGNGRGDNLQNANWSVQVSDDSVLTAEVIPATATAAPILRLRGLLPSNDAWVQVTADVCGIEGAVKVPVTVLEPSGVVSADISIPCVDRGQVARYTTQNFQFDIMGADGLAILPDEVEVTYEITNDGVIELDRENHSFYAAADGETAVTVTVEQGSFSYTETFPITVAQEGENRLADKNATFSDGTFGDWYGMAEPGTPNALTWTEMADDGTGNYAMKVTINPEATANSAGALGTNWMLPDGAFGSLMPGHIYEMSFRVKVEDLVIPEGARFHLQLRPQFEDKTENKRNAATIGEMSETRYITLDKFSDQWTTVTMPVRAPIGGSKMFYGMPQINLNCHYNSVNGDGNLTGYCGTIWFDDFKLREVGVGSVSVVPKLEMTDIGVPTVIYVKPLTTNGNVICPDPGLIDGNVTLSSTDEDVVKVVGDMEIVRQQDYGPTHVDYDYPSFKAQLVGRNAEAQLVASYTIAGHTAYGALDLNVTGMPDRLRDITYTLDGFRSVVLKKDEEATAALSGLTTQLVEVSEQELRENGSVYFTSSNEKIVVVDAVSGNITCISEGTAVVTAYANLHGVTASSQVIVTVTDDTDLTAMEITSNVEYVGVGSALQLYTAGTKASGGSADMSLYPVAWSVSDEEIAAISADGRLLGLKEGLVTVTAEVGVMRKAVIATKTIKVVENSELAPVNVQMDFADGRAMDWTWYTLNKNGMQINRERTYLNGETLTFNSSRGLQLKDAPVGQGIVIDFHVPRDGWYYLDIFDASFYDGAICDLILDDHFMGIMDCIDGTFQLAFGEQELCNTVYLEAGKHTIEVNVAVSGQIYLGRLHLRQSSDPHAMELTATIGESELVAGESTEINVSVMGKNGKQQKLYVCDQAPAFTNYYLLKTSDPNVVTTSGNTITAKAPGQATVTLVCEADHETLTKQFAVTVGQGIIAEAELTAENTTVKPDAEPFALILSAFNADGTRLDEITAEVTYRCDDETIATVSADGIVTLTGKEGSALITASIAEGSRIVTAELWLTVTRGKTEPTLYTYQERANARENVLKYSWAWQQKESVVRQADFYVENVAVIYDLWIREGFPRATHSKYEGDNSYGYCPICGEYLIEKYGVYPYIVDPINNPWKITCPVCKSDFPSNDFGAYYKSGLDERGYFHEDRADKSLLVNELYPEMGEGWGVDDGWGYETGKICAENGMPETYIWIANYLHSVFRDLFHEDGNSMVIILDALGKAYMYTGDEKYGSAGAILLDRVADIYPEYDLCQYDIMSYNHSDGNSGRGKFVGSIWEAAVITPALANAADIFWPAMDNPDVVEFLRTKATVKGMNPEDITPEYVRSNVDNGILLEIREVAETMHAFGNFGMVQNAMARAAVALDRLPETAEMIEWVNRAEKVGGVHHDSTNYGGGVLDALAGEVDRDGFSDEVSVQYNNLWTDELINIADALSGYTRVEGVDLWQNQKFINMFTARTRIGVTGGNAPMVGETGWVQYRGRAGVTDGMIKAFIGSGDRAIAQAIYAANGNKVDGIHADIFTKDPESGIRSKIQQIINEDGEYDQSESDMMAGFGLGILREGPARYLKGVNDAEFSDYWMFFGKTGGGGHARFDSLNIDVDFRGLTLSSGMGYPLNVNGGDPERQQWVRNTISHNTVVVDRTGQVEQVFGSFPLHFEDAGKAKVMDADASNAYPETEIYRRTVVTVKAPGGEDYAVDFFRILGGSEHVYSFHGISQTDPATTGLELTYQPMGTYAGADIPFGAFSDYDGKLTFDNDIGSGFSWLDQVSRDSDPDTTFSVDWAIEDYHKYLPTSTGIHMRLTMLSDKPMTEVALANGYPPRKEANPEHVEYLLVKNSGEEGLDTLFTAVIEPYQHENYIASAQLVSMDLVSGTEAAPDKAAAIKVTLKTGRVDYIMYATNPDCTYEVDGKFTFCGFAGVVSYEGEQVVYAWGNEATNVADVIEDAKPRLTGKVLDYTRGLSMEGYTMTIELEQSAAEEELTGRYIYVNNDLDRNAAYRIYGAEVNGNTAVLDLHTQTLTRKYLDPFDLDKGFIHNIEVGQTYTIPLSESFDVAELFTYTTDQVVKAGSRMSVTAGVSGDRVTYEAEGMPSGMKITASNGAITWTTSKTQTGRYPITVKAVRDGEVVGTMSFTVYVVSYSGSTYAPDQCAHSKSVDFGTEIVCPACGTITKVEAEEVQKFDIVGSNMTLGNELKMNVLVKSSDLGDGTYTAKITHNGEVTEAEFVKYNSNYHYVTCAVSAKQMADTITVEVFDENGEAVSNVYETSVRTYAMRLLGMNQTDEVKTLLVDMLNYGAEAQTYFKYNEADLANSLLTEDQKALATETVPCTNRQVKGENFYGTNLSLEDSILLNLFFKNVKDGFTAKIIFTSYDGSVKTIVKEPVPYSGSIYKIVVDDVVLADAFSTVTATIYDANGNAVGSGTDSVESYIARTGDNALNEAIMKFAYAAKEYLS